MAAGFHTEGPGRCGEPAVSDGFFCADEAVRLWESRLTGVTEEELRRRREPRVVRQMTCDGCEEFVLSDQLRAALAAAGPDVLDGIADEWAAIEARDGDPDCVTPEQARPLLSALATLARTAGGAGRDIYCVWS